MENNQYTRQDLEAAIATTMGADATDTRIAGAYNQMISEWAGYTGTEAEELATFRHYTQAEGKIANAADLAAARGWATGRTLL